MGIVNFDEVSPEIELQVCDNITRINDVLSKGRVRIFYRGLNRNRTFISDEFAAKLEKSLPYTPIKGIYLTDEEDFSDHGETNSQGRIYGIVPENPNSSYEEHLDSDGIVRSYLCCDVYYFSGLYEEANQIFSKPQSMEIYSKTLKGEWQINPDDGKPMFYFYDGCFVGLQVLGDDVEPCFEGSAFYSYCKNIETITTYLQNIKQKEEIDKMELKNFRLSDNQKAQAIFDLLNKDCTAETGPSYWIYEIYDDYALVEDVANSKLIRVYYTKENDVVSLGERVDCFIVDVTQEELVSLNAIKAVNENSYEKIDENFVRVEEVQAVQTELETVKEELETTKIDFAAKETEQAEIFAAKSKEFENEKAVLLQEQEYLKNEISSLDEFKKNIENEQKEEIINSFDKVFEEEVLENYRKTKNDFTVEELEKEMCVKAYKLNPTAFSKKTIEEPSTTLVYKNGSNKNYSEMSSCERILERYKNGGSK